MLIRKTSILITIMAAVLPLGKAGAETLTVGENTIVEWKSVYGQVESRDRVPARTRIGGTVAELNVTEGDSVEAGQIIARVEDNKLQFQIDSLDARLESLDAQLQTAKTELERGQQLIERGVVTAQRVEQLQTGVDIIQGEISSLNSQKLLIRQQITEGDVLAPDAGLILSVPVSRGSVVVAGEVAAVIASGGFYLRLAVPERHADDLIEGSEISLGNETINANRQTGRLAKLYPVIEGGRLQADVEVDNLDGRFVGRRVPVRLPVGKRTAILIPESAIQQSGGLDVVAVETKQGERRSLVVVPGTAVEREGTVWREILSGLSVGDKVITDHE
jgi:RND family efflux transporter MFP subunit